jgi:hypothetical protein
MELHPGKSNAGPLPGKVDLFSLWEAGLEYVASVPALAAQLENIKARTPAHCTPEIFWQEYIWVAYVPGLSAAIIAKKWAALTNAIGPWDMLEPSADFEPTMERLRPVLANERKARAVVWVREVMRVYGWDSFKPLYLDDLESLTKLPMIGPITRFHLARNLGFDVAKPDIHLERLAKQYRFDGTEDLCSRVADYSGLRVGAVDFVLWAYCAAVGTKHLEASG